MYAALSMSIGCVAALPRRSLLLRDKGVHEVAMSKSPRRRSVYGPPSSRIVGDSEAVVGWCPDVWSANRGSGSWALFEG